MMLAYCQHRGQADEKLAERGLTDVKEAAIVTFPIRLAAQDAAIVAIGELGKKHALLRESAIQALVSLSSFKTDIAQRVLSDLRSQRAP